MLKKILGVLIIVEIFAGCASVNNFLGEPDISLSEVVIESLDLEGVTFRCDYIVTNPYPVGIRVSNISTDIIYEEETIIELETDGGLKLGAGASSDNSILFKVPYESIIQLAGDGREQESLPFIVSGEASFDISSIPYIDKSSLTIPFHKEFDVPVFKPELKVSGGRVKLPSAKEIAKALVTGGLNILRAGVVAGQIVLGKSIPDDVFEGIDLDVGILFDLEIDNRGGAQWSLDLHNCSIDTGMGALLEMRPQNDLGRIEASGTIVHMETVVNTLEWGAFIVGLSSGAAAGASLVIESSLSFPEMQYDFELPLNIEQELSLKAFQFGSK